MDRLAHDIKYAFRALRGSPAVTVTALLTLILAIGANTAIFSVIDAVLLKPLPYPRADRIVSIWEKRPGGQPNSMSAVNYQDYAAQSTVFERIAATTNCCASVRLTDGAAPVMLAPEHVSSPYFDILGIPPAIGRTFLTGEDTPGRDRVAVLSNKMWAAQFGSDRTVLGRPIHLDGERYQVIGVMPAGSFDRMYPDVWLPLTFTAANTSRSSHWLISGTGAAVALLKPGVTISQARAEMDAIAARIASDHPDTNKGWGTFVDLYESVAADQNLRRSLYLLLAAVGMVLLIGCLNLANVMLARGLARQREMTVKLALGATPARLIRQVFTESVLLSTTGAAIGLALTLPLTGALMKVLGTLPMEPGALPRGVPPEATASLDMRVVLFTLAVALACGIGFGIAPAAGVFRLAGVNSLGHGQRATTGGFHRQLRNALVVAEIAVACVLFTAAGVLIHSLANMGKADAGIDSTNVVTAYMPFPQHHFATGEAFRSYLHRVDERLHALPGVQAVAFSNGLPFQGVCCGAFFQVANRPYQVRAQRPVADWKIVTAPYFRVMGIRIVKGRTLSALDTSDAPAVMVINETMARMHFGQEEPIGQHVLLDTSTFGSMVATGEKPYEIVGVVADERMMSFDDKHPHPVIYISNEQEPSDDVANIAIRTGADPSLLEKSIQTAVADVDSNQTVTSIKTMTQVRAESMTSDVVRTALYSSFAAAALLLAAIGIYGVTSYTVGQRQRELGIRAALGATPGDLIRLVVGAGLRLTAIGLTLGCLAGIEVARVLGAFLFGVGPSDGVTLATTAGILAAVATLASFIPARLAARATPLDALRAE